MQRFSHLVHFVLYASEVMKAKRSVCGCCVFICSSEMSKFILILTQKQIKSVTV